MTDFVPVWASMQAGLPVLILHLALTTFLWGIALALAHGLSKWRFGRDDARENHAVTLVHGGEALALALPLAAALAGSVNAADNLLWGGVVALVQLGWSLLSVLAMRAIVRRVGQGDMSAAIHLIAVRLGFALLNSAAIGS